MFTNRCELAYDRGIRHIDACSIIYGLPVLGLFICLVFMNSSETLKKMQGKKFWLKKLF